MSKCVHVQVYDDDAWDALGLKKQLELIDQFRSIGKGLHRVNDAEGNRIAKMWMVAEHDS